MKTNTRQLQVRAYTVVVNWDYRLQVFKHARQGKQLEIEHLQYPPALCVLVQKARAGACPRTEHGTSHTKFQSYGVLHDTPRVCAIESIPEQL